MPTAVGLNEASSSPNLAIVSNMLPDCHHKLSLHEVSKFHWHVQRRKKPGKVLTIDQC
jgi:hypothetical protein